MELAPPNTADGYYHVDIFDPPGVPTHDESSKPGNLVRLTQQYVNEVFHNVYCHRLFIWEQVSSHWLLSPCLTESMKSPHNTGELLLQTRNSILKMTLSGSLFMFKQTSCS